MTDDELLDLFNEVTKTFRLDVDEDDREESCQNAWISINTISPRTKFDVRQKIAQILNTEGRDRAKKYIYAICYNELRQIWRRRGGGPPTGQLPNDGGDDRDPPSGIPEPGEGVERDEIIAIIREILTEREWQILKLRYWEGKTWDEIAEEMDMSISSVYRHRDRALAKIREYLLQSGEHEDG